MSESDLVKEFTIAANQEVCKVPTIMTKDEVTFICKMIIDEMLELCSTVSSSNEAKEMLKNCIDEAKEINLFKGNCEEDLIAEQQDAFVDIIYYIQNASVKKGVDLSSIFKVVHQANMNKRDPKTGLFLKRSDGKIIKPDGWTAPDISEEIRRQINDKKSM